MSKYEQIYHKILNSIENGLYAVGDTLPGEFELMKQFSVSRDTVRKALQLLAQNGYIQKSQGRGSIVLDFNRFDFPLSGVISFKEVASAMHEPVSTEVICFEKIHPDARIASILQMRSEEEVWFIQRLRRISNEAVILDTDILNAEIIPGLTRTIAQDSLYEYIEDTLHLTIAYARKEITCQNISGLDEQVLDLHHYNMVVSVESCTYLDDARIFQYTSSRHRPDRFRFIDFARREQKA